ncbi:hypothetical protein IL308_10050 [Lactococcus lactis]|uniref:hypothetical protein n=1 Tax=Lactococcus lactis TaxID=1358 RepID=UPI0019133485|nr:hypothetical protein [Lactococcus lactis]MBK5077098.1 hypothetical protein [Lactococcus lactis]
MTTLTKITRGMQNGAETINDNFDALNEEVKTASDGAVKLSGDQTVAGKKTFSDDASFKNISVSGDINQRYATTSFEIGYGLSVTAKRVGSLVTITFRGSNTTQLGENAKPTEKIPAGYRPIEAESIDFLVTGRHLDTYYYFNPDGSISYNGEMVPVNSFFRGVRSYFTKDAWPTA